jgi:hypothetical protein
MLPSLAAIKASPPPATAIRLSATHRWTVYISLAVLTLSGCIWLYAHHFLGDPNNFAALIHPAEPWSMKIHGMAAIIFAVVIGSLTTLHIRLGWRRKKNRASAMMLLTVISLLAITGYLLYYAGGNSLRTWASTIHWVGGIATPILLAIHIWLGRRARALLILKSK